MSFLSRSNVGTRRYGDRMPTTLEELKSDVDTLKARMDGADSRFVETNKVLTHLAADVFGIRSDLVTLKTYVKENVGSLKKDLALVPGRGAPCEGFAAIVVACAPLLSALRRVSGCRCACLASGTS